MSRLKRVTCVCAALVGCAGVFCGSQAFAVTVTTDNQVAAAGATTFTPTYVPSSSDLINGLAPSAQAGNFALESAGGAPGLADGTYGSNGTGVSRPPPAFRTPRPGGGATPPSTP